MTKQEFLAMSLPYKLKVYVKYNHKPNNSELETMIGIVDDCIVTDIYEEDIAPLSISNYGLCLRSLSDLTKEIKHKGEKFVLSEYWDKSLLDKYRKSVCSDLINMSKHNYFDGYLPFFVCEKLIEFHFDLAGLISKGEAIDVNTLEENPYK